ncbi:MAG: MerR family transcriptional regulator [Candidatus Atribacteria bacterium]|nr:MerR family transcriptional regulator [Candidatus Atribacteria bacterium]
MDRKEEYFTIRMVSEMTKIHPQTLRYYEKAGLLKPERGKGGVRLYKREDIEKVMKIKTLTQDMGVNLAGVEVIFKLTEQLEALRTENKAFLNQEEEKQ